LRNTGIEDVCNACPKHGYLTRCVLELMTLQGVKVFKSLSKSIKGFGQLI